MVLASDIKEDAFRHVLFANDIALVGKDGREVQNRLAKWQQELGNVYLKISRFIKNGVQFCNFDNYGYETEVKFGDHDANDVALAACSDFKYLGSLLQSDGERARREALN